MPYPTPVVFAYEIMGYQRKNDVPERWGRGVLQILIIMIIMIIIIIMPCAFESLVFFLQ